MGVVEVSAVIDGGLLTGRSAEDFGAPCVAGPLVLLHKKAKDTYRWLSK